MRKRYQFPLKQHIGAPAIPVVGVNDRVLRGQRIANRPSEQLGANLFSSVTGTVTEVTDSRISVLADEEQPRDYVKLSARDPLALIEESGLVGLGGAGFPTYAKLASPFEEGGTVIVNAAECEPILAHNIRAAEENPQQLLRGLQIVMEIVRARRGIIAIKSVHATAVERLRAPLASAAVPEEKIRVALLPDQYPMGEERAVVRETLGRLLGPQSLPKEANAVVLNAETICRIQEAVDLKKPLIDKNLTIAGKLKGNEELIQVFFDVPLGCSVRDAFDMAGGLAEGWGELIMGGPFTGKRTELDAPVIKTTGGLIGAECFLRVPEKLGLLVCACGGDRARLAQQAESMGSTVADVQYCKQAHPVGNSLKCENPGRCPGQVQKVLALKKAGAQAVLISSCTDCTNTVMACAPALGLPVYHCTDGALRAVNHKLIRRIRIDAE
ncbi:MAG: proline reductase-associated electron transfer protein PrdC [Aristaeellaceae bacterium]